MNAKEQYKQAWRNMRISTKGMRRVAGFRRWTMREEMNASQMMRNCYYGEYSRHEPAYKAYESFMARKTAQMDSNLAREGDSASMCFWDFIQCLEAAQVGLAWANRNSWYFLVGGIELEFTNAEMGRFARYFKQSLYMTHSQFYTLTKAGSEDLTQIAFENCEAFPVRPKQSAYRYFIMGQLRDDMRYDWVKSHNQAIRKTTVRTVPRQADYDTEQSDMQAEMEMQRYG